MNVRRRIGKVLSVSVKEAREIWRTRLFLVLAFAVPFIMFIVFGYGISLDIENMPFGYVDNDKTQSSALLVDKFRNRYFDLSRELSGTAEAETLLSKGSLRAVLVIPPDFSRSIYRGDATVLQFLIDGGYPYRAITVKGYAEAIVAKFNMEIARERLESSGMQWRTFRPIAVETRYLFNESLKSSNALIPGLLAIILLMNPAVLTALAITREKEFGTIYNIYASPMKKWEFLAGKIIPYLIISAINFAVIVATIRLLFHVHMKGTVLSLVPGAALYVLINVSIGLLVSSVTRTMVSAQVVTIIVTVIPAFLYSGLLIPVANLGREAKAMAHVYPSMHFMKIIHGVYLKDLAFSSLLPHAAFLLAYFAILFTVGVATFRKKEG